MTVAHPLKRNSAKVNDSTVSKKSKNEKTLYSGSSLLNTVSDTFFSYFIEPGAVQALARKLEQSVRQIESEVSLLSEQVDSQDKAIVSTVKNVAQEYMV